MERAPPPARKRVPQIKIKDEVHSGSAVEGRASRESALEVKSRKNCLACYFEESFRRDESIDGTERRNGTIAPFDGSAAAEARAKTSC